MANSVRATGGFSTKLAALADKLSQHPLHPLSLTATFLAVWRYRARLISFSAHKCAYEGCFCDHDNVTSE